MTRYKGDNVTETVWDKMQYKLECCGVLSIDDWQNISWTEDRNCTAPASCKVTNKDMAVLVSSDSGNSTASNNTNSTDTAEECLADMTTPHHSEVNTNMT